MQRHRDRLGLIKVLLSIKLTLNQSQAMKLKPIIQQRAALNRPVTVNFTKSGLLSFSKGAKEKIPELATAKKVLILQDEEKPDDFYLHLIQEPLKTDENYPNIRKNTHNQFISNYRSAYEAILEHFKADHKAIRIPIGGFMHEEGRRFWTLITHVLKKQ